MAFDNRLSILFSLFHGNTVFRDVLESNRSSKYIYIVNLIKIVELFDRSSDQIGKSEEFDHLKRFLTLGFIKPKNFDKAGFVKILLSKVLNMPACIQYSENSRIPTAYIHDVTFRPGESSTFVSMHLDAALRQVSPKFKKLPSPALIIHVDRPNYDNNMLLPAVTLPMGEFVEGGLDPDVNYQLAAIVCRYGLDFSSFVRYSVANSEENQYEWKYCSKTGKVSSVPESKLENQLQFWSNMPDFLALFKTENYTNEPIYCVLTSAVFLVYVPENK